MPIDSRQTAPEFVRGQKITPEIKYDFPEIESKERDYGNERTLLEGFGTINDYSRISQATINTTQVIEKDLIIFTTGQLEGTQLITQPIFIAHYPVEIIGISEIHQNPCTATINFSMNPATNYLLTTAFSLNTANNTVRIFEKPNFIKANTILNRSGWIKIDIISGSETGYTGSFYIYFKYIGKGDYKLE